ncbi:uncharacterized protein [Amphiura filiformis]|uniref:uncharacterized protein n=1 Tax=Amphiura filiformis TaxID=82378 RepID=UPI003B2139DC
MFLEEFSSLLTALQPVSTRLLITGDFNVHVDDANDRLASSFQDILQTQDLQQHVLYPTHIGGHTLDLLICRKTDDLVSSISVHDHLPSDHFGVKCQINLTRPPPSRKFVRSRKLRSIDIDQFRSDIRASPLSSDCQSLDSVHSYAEKYDSILRDLLDHHAPELERSVILRPHAPWYSDALRAAKQERRKQLYADQCSSYKQLLDDAKTSYHRKELADADQRDLFRVVDKLVKPKVDTVLPTHDSSNDLADQFADYFHTKISTLRHRLNCSHTTSSAPTPDATCCTSFETFQPVSEDEVLDVIKQSHITSCLLDPLPSCIFKESIPELLPMLTKVVNHSLASGYFPATLKHAVVSPLLKKAKLDRDDLSNYRPISNLKFLGKLIERIVISQLQVYLREHNLIATMQSAYRQNHGTETALVRVQNDILCALDKGKEAFLVLLDFSCAFDTIDHQLLLQRFATRYGINGTALTWIKSYLECRTQYVAVNGCISKKVTLDCGVPQGSVAGPLMFILYSAPLPDIITSYGISTVAYADDTQLYITFKPEDREHAIRVLEKCIAEVRRWAVENRLVLNDAKTELLYICSRFTTVNMPSPFLAIGDSVIFPSSCARNLGAIFDSNLCMKDHIDSICRSAMTAIRKIGQIRHFIDDETAAKLVHAFVTSRLDSCNALVYVLPDSYITKLQLIQNTAARLVARIPRSQHITPVLQSLHWLPIKKRAAYKILLMTYKALNQLAPQYISDIVSYYKPVRNLRSSNKLSLTVTSRPSTKFYGERAFVYAAPSLWNNLPLQVRSSITVSSFKSRLKTHLFNI